MPGKNRPAPPFAAESSRKPIGEAVVPDPPAFTEPAVPDPPAFTEPEPAAALAKTKGKPKDVNQRLGRGRNRATRDARLVFPLILALESGDPKPKDVETVLERISGEPCTSYVFAEHDGLDMLLLVPSTLSPRTAMEARRSLRMFRAEFPTATMLLTAAAMGLHD